ncbi:hypothetical protein HY637_05120, partial [Candidatus Woesearchaeota archaeon]|nr:hypothetical protein [Candidatus Woesearchaeota archaeon]
EFEKKRDLNGFDVNPEEKFLVDMFSQISEKLRQKYNYSNEEIFGLWNSENSLLIPAAIFAGKLSPAEALAKYLKENHSLGYHEISELIGRDERGIWANYKRAIKKMPWPFEIVGSITVPVSIFKSENSILESLIVYLKDVKKMRNKSIAKLLNKNPANVWTISSRAKKKENESNASEHRLRTRSQVTKNGQ